MPGLVGGREGTSALVDVNGLGEKMATTNGTYANSRPGMVNGTGDHLSNGVDHSPSAVEQTMSESPPEIERISANYMPLSRLFQRTAQDCFNDLNEMITALASLPATQPAGRNVLPNGADTASGLTVSSEKKLRWLYFANGNREKFIKLLVLLQWSRRVDEVSAIIDLVVWANNQVQFYDAACHFMGEIKKGLESAKVPSPDIETALEALTLGGSERMPDLGYIPPKPLTAENLLSTLQNINMLLHLRLNLHEDLPQKFKNFSIASGRATFIIASEFEVDVSIADEDLSTQYYFIDFRFLFPPVSEIPAGHLRNELEGKANEVLASEGLAGCFHFLHDFVLTHKLNLMRRQAVELNRSSWAGTLRVEQVHRSLIIQYWSDRPGEKSWVEIGIASGKQDVSASRGAEMSYLAVRWFKEGQQMKDADIRLGLDNGSLEATLKSAISHHIVHILTSIHAQFTNYALAHSLLPLPTLSLSYSEPSQNTLLLPVMADLLASERNTLKAWCYRLSDLEGAFSIRYPVNDFTDHCNNELRRQQQDNDPKFDQTARIRYWQARERQDWMEREARSFGWETENLRTVDLDEKSFKKSCGETADELTMFKRPYWTNGWVACSIFEQGTNFWWIGRLIARDNVKSLTDLVKMPIQMFNHNNNKPSSHPDFWTGLAFATVKAITYQCNEDKLNEWDMDFNVRFHAYREQRDRRPSVVTISLADILGVNKLTTFWTTDSVSLRYGGLQASKLPGSPHVVVQSATVGARLSPTMITILQSIGPTVQVHTNRVMCLHFRSLLGLASPLKALRGHIRHIDRLRVYAKVLEGGNYLNPITDLQVFKVDYDHQPDGEIFQVSIRFSDNDDRAMIRFHPITNPHHTITDILQTAYDATFKSTRCKLSGHKLAFRGLLDAVNNTLPILRVIHAISIDNHRPVASVARDALCERRLMIGYERPRCIISVDAEAAADGASVAQWRISLVPMSKVTVDTVAILTARHAEDKEFANAVKTTSGGWSADVVWIARLLEALDTELLARMDEEVEDKRREAHMAFVHKQLGKPGVGSRPRPGPPAEIVVLDE